MAISRIGTNLILDATIATADIADDAITTAKLAAGTIAVADIADDAITAAKLATNAVVTASIVAGSVTTTELGADAVTNAKIGDNAIDSDQYVDGSIDTIHISDNAITVGKMADLARGQIIAGNSAGNPVALALGSANKILTSDGTDIAWASNVTGNVSGTALTVTQAAQTAITSLGTLTALTVDTVTVNGAEITSSGALTLDTTGQLNLDSGNDEIHLKGSGTTFAKFFTSGGDFYINHPTSNEDIFITGNDGGSTITALKFDMSEAGDATFNRHLILGATSRLYFDGGTDTYIYQSSDNNFKFIAGTTDILSMGSDGIVFNEDSQDRDIRFESNDNANMLFIDSGNNRVGIGTASPAGILHTQGTGNQQIKFECTNANHVRIELDADRSTEGHVIGSFDGLWNGTRVGTMQVLAGADTTNKDDGAISFSTTSGGTEAEKMRITTAGNVGIGTTTPDEKLKVNGTFKTSGKVGLNAAINADAQVMIYTSDATDNILRVNAGSGSYTGTALEVQIARQTGESGYTLFKCISKHDNVSPITRFSVRGDGLTTIDGANTNTN